MVVSETRRIVVRGKVVDENSDEDGFYAVIEQESSVVAREEIPGLEPPPGLSRSERAEYDRQVRDAVAAVAAAWEPSGGPGANAVIVSDDDEWRGGGSEWRTPGGWRASPQAIADAMLVVTDDDVVIKDREGILAGLQYHGLAAQMLAAGAADLRSDAQRERRPVDGDRTDVRPA